MEDVATMTDDELIFFYGNLHHWTELVKDRIDKIKVERKLHID
jgi:hypothetical protein